MSDESCSRDQWTDRQRQVLDLLARGRTNPEIADELGVSLAGAKWHVSEVLSKLGVASREEAAEIWRAENRALPRAGRRLRALIGMPAALAATAAGTLGVAALAGFAAFGDPTDNQQAVTAATPVDPATASNGIQDFTTEEATALAYELAQDYLDMTGSPGEPTMADKSPIDGRPMRLTDMILRERRFEPLAGDVAFTVITGGLGGYPPTDFWLFHFELGPFVYPGTGPNDFYVQVTFEDGTGELKGAGAGGIPVDPPTAMSLDEAIPRIALIDDWNGNRATLSLYGSPGEPCLRLDQTAGPGSVDHYCTSDLPGNVPGLILLPAGGVAGAAGPEVTRVTILQEDGTTVDVPSVDAPGPYAGTLRPFLLLHALPGTLQLWGAGGELLLERPLAKPVSGPAAPGLNSVPQFEHTATGPGATEPFALLDPSLLYGFSLDIPEDTAHLRVTAECDAGTELVLDRTGLVTPQDHSLVVTFPPGSTTCRLLVDVPADVSWRIQPK